MKWKKKIDYRFEKEGMSRTKRAFDIVIWGATGVTGKGCAKILNQSYPSVSFAIAGRDQSKLIEVKKNLGLRESVAILTSKLEDDGGLDSIFSQTKVVISCAGPYAKVGMPVVAACVRNGCHYIDITGEPQFIRAVIDSYHEEAISKKLKLVSTCGWDCVPSDLGVYFIVKQLEKSGTTPCEVQLVVDDFKGGISGGTIASVLNMLKQPTGKLLETRNPYCLAPRDSASGFPRVPDTGKKSLMTLNGDRFGIHYNSFPHIKAWCVPYVMQAIDTRVVHRTNALLNYRYGKDFIYTEAMRAKGGLLGAIASSVGMAFFGLLLFFPPTRMFLQKFVLPAPGTVIGNKDLDKGFFTMKLVGRGIKLQQETAGGDKKSSSVDKGESVIVNGNISSYLGDPGYKQTCLMAVESAMCIVQDERSLPASYGSLTPAVAFEEVLLKRITDKGINFSIQSS